jgi:hypothetical protein
MRLTGPLGNAIDTTCADQEVCLKMARLHRRISSQLAEPCPDLLEVAELWEQAAMLKAER